MDYKNRDEVPQKYKWDLEAMIKDSNEFEKLILFLKKEIKKLITYKGKILNDSETLYNFLKQEQKVNILFNKLYVYGKYEL